MKLFSTAAIGLVLSALSLSAQQPSSVDVSIFTFQYAQGYEKVFLNSRAGEYNEISLSSANILGPFKAVLTETREIFLHERKRNQEGVEIYPAILRVKIPASVSNPLLVLVPRSGDQPYGALVIDSSLRKFPQGSYQLINFTKSDIRALIGKTPVLAPPLKITFFDPSSNSDDLLNVHFQYKRLDHWKTFGRTRWMNEKNKRSLLVAYVDPRTERMKIKGIPLKPSLRINE